MLEIQKKEQQWRAARPIIDQNPLEVLELLRGELEEAIEVANDHLKLPGELADLVILVMTVANISGIDMEDVLDRKILRNYAKYPAAELQEGDFSEKRLLLRDAWTPEDDAKFGF